MRPVLLEYGSSVWDLQSILQDGLEKVQKMASRFATGNYTYQTDVVVVVLLFYVHGKHLRSYRDGQLT